MESQFLRRLCKAFRYNMQFISSSQMAESVFYLNKQLGSFLNVFVFFLFFLLRRIGIDFSQIASNSLLFALAMMEKHSRLKNNCCPTLSNNCFVIQRIQFVNTDFPFQTNYIIRGTQREKNRKKPYNAVFCFLISFYGLLKGYLCELTLFDLFGCGS